MAPQLPTRHLGKNGPQVPALGFGLMGLSAFYGNGGTDAERLKVLDRAHEIGETFWDSSDIYGDNEDLLGKWFAANPEKRKDIFLATKFAFSFEDGNMVVSSKPEYVKKALEKSLKRLGVESVDLYYCHRVDKETPVEKTIEAMAELQKEGKIKYIGLSEVSSETLRRACKVAHVDALQIEYSPFCTEIEDPKTNVLKTCRELGIATVAYSPLGRGMLTGAYKSPSDFEEGDFRLNSPRFSPENFKQNLKLVDGIGAVAKKKNCTPGQLTLAWLLAQGDDIIPIPGTKKIKYLEENVKALDVKLSKEDVEEVRKLVEGAEVHGDRYPEAMAGHLFADTPALKV
ncbi:probable IN2-2 protein [Rhynchosporium secalis]|uniref:Probable IN2-2 protein n=1 Tax=Rhynchosporium secalis TaxID=38038 RepID=A0A1E1M729_RHYSE|nr:probable IN2-2 protein [Rhynchosporium secalis]